MTRQRTKESRPFKGQTLGPSDATAHKDREQDQSPRFKSAEAQRRFGADQHDSTEAKR